MPSMCDKTTVKYCKTLAVERAVVSRTGDVVLPDYYPDAMEVLSAYADFSVRESELDGRKLNIKGNVRCTVLYQTEGGILQAITDISDFEKAMELPELPEDPYILVRAETAYISGKVSNSRKLGYSAEGMLEVTVQANMSASVVIANDQLQTMGEKRMITSLAGSASKRIRIEEDIEIPTNKPQIANLLSCRHSAKVLEQKTVSNRVVTKGALVVQLVYSSPEGNLETHETEIPFNQILDVDGVDEECRISTELMPVSMKTETYENDGGENRILACEAELMLSAAAYRDLEYDLCRDAYLVGFESDVTQAEISFVEAAAESVTEKAIRQSVDFAEKIERVLTFTGMLTSFRPEMVESEMKITGNLYASMIVQLQDGKKKCIEAPIPVIIDLPTDRVAMNVSGQLENASYTLLADSAVEVRASVTVRMLTAGATRAQFVSDVLTADPPVPAQKSDYVVLYYPDDAETFWEIGKKFRISEGMLRMANGFEDEAYPKKMLLIPRK